MSTPHDTLFRKSALERLAAPEGTDVRPRWPSYALALVVAAVALTLVTGLFAAWLR